MKRICIYVTYDFENIADDYIGYMLQELRKVADRLIVVCNYPSIARGADNIRPYADKIYYRKNIGYDAGAYKDALCSYLGWDEVSRYDELLLINDSFYGPLYPIRVLFDRMEESNADYWGIIRAPKGKFDDGYTYDSHIQSYFWAFGRRVLESALFRNFWQELTYPQSLYQAVTEFEIGCNRFLENCGFKGAAFTDYEPECSFRENEIPYMQYPLELIRDFKVPILKRRSLYFSNKGYANALEAFKYVESQNIYDVDLIKKHLLRISQSDVQSQEMFDFLRLKSFYKEHERLYFYGAGTYGQNLAVFFQYAGWKFSGFLVTNIDNQLENCTAFDKAELNSNDGIIITVANKEICLQILNNISRRYSKEQILYPNFVQE